MSWLLPVSYPLLLATDPFCPVVEFADPFELYPFKFIDRECLPLFLSGLYRLNSGQSDPLRPDKLIFCSIFCVSIIFKVFSVTDDVQFRAVGFHLAKDLMLLAAFGLLTGRPPTPRSQPCSR